MFEISTIYQKKKKKVFFFFLNRSDKFCFFFNLGITPWTTLHAEKKLYNITRRNTKESLTYNLYQYYTEEHWRNFNMNKSKRRRNKNNLHTNVNVSKFWFFFSARQAPFKNFLVLVLRLQNLFKKKNVLLVESFFFFQTLAFSNQCNFFKNKTENQFIWLNVLYYIYRIWKKRKNVIHGVKFFFFF